MKINLGDNIQKFRKESGMTQEQLASAMGVTEGAVSKWENGYSNPDIELIPELADFFEVSVDVLLGYEWTKHSLGETVEKLKEYVKEKEFEKGIPMAIKVIQKYPNQFELLYLAAKLWHGKAITLNDKEAFKEANKYYKKSMNFVNRSIDKVNIDTIKYNIAEIYGLQEEYDEAIRILKEISDNGVYDGLIGHYLERMGNYSEAKSKLQTFFVQKQLIDQTGYLQSLARCYENEGKAEEAIAVYEYNIMGLEGLIVGETGCYVRRICALSYLDLATKYLELGDMNKTYLCMVKAIDNGKKFDLNQDFRMSGVRFCEEVETVASDSLGTSTTELIKMILNMAFEGFEWKNELLERIKAE
ncbi:MAG: hypothetical protein K0R15_1877 [Clostridiales bacterium]|jgi:transcriptional regulator with XRE-family HTH domain|nr:hypothetical protein [Clostridiales bacterium]